MKDRRHPASLATALIALTIAVCSQMEAQSPGALSAAGVPSLVEIYWHSSKTVVAPGITNIIVLDEEIARAQTSSDVIQFFGLSRGETVALGYMGGKAVSLRLRVVERPLLVLSPGSLRRMSEMAQGTFGSTVQLANTGGVTTTSILNGVTWAQPVGDKGHLDMVSQMEDNMAEGSHPFNVRHASIYYHDPVREVRAMDFITSLTGANTYQYASPFSTSDAIELRGAEVGVKHGRNRYSLFGGTTIPFFYLTLGATRDVAGFSFERNQSDKLALFTTTTFINTPLDFLGQSSVRQNDFMQTAGFSYLPDKKWTLRALGGSSNHGSMGRGEVGYTGRGVTAYAQVSKSAPMFPLNQVLSLFSGTTSIKAAASFRSGASVAESVYYQHSETAAVGTVLHAGSSDYLSPTIAWRINKANDLSFIYTFSRNNGGFTSQSSTGNRFDTNWHYQITPRVSNAAQFTIGSVQDPLQLNSEDQMAFRESLIFPVGASDSMFVAYEHDRRNPSLAAKLSSELSLLSPALQQLFLQDPVSFVESSNLPPEIRALLEAEHPISDSVSAAGQFRVGNKLRVNPNFSFARASISGRESWTPFAGYGLVYQLSPTFQLNSSLTNVWLLGNSLSSAQRTTLLSFGFVKSFVTAPDRLIPGHRTRVIEGRVFRDNNLNGPYNAGEPGLPGVQVQLENGDSVLTDREGRYKFNGVSADEHQVTIALTQFRDPVRMTTPSQLNADLLRDHVAVMNFGVVNFARLVGNVFNDLRFEGRRQPDSAGMNAIRLVLTAVNAGAGAEDKDKQKRTIITESSGDFELDDVPPGDYTLTVDAASLPSNYSLPTDSFPVHIAPVSTVVADVPARALRSIAGRVFVRVLAEPAAQAVDSAKSDLSKLKIGGMPAGTTRTQRGGQGGGKSGQAGRGQAQGAGGQAGATADYNLVPLAGVQLTAGRGTVKTDDNGSFLLRDLPAGDMTITMVPVKPLAAGLKVPSGVVHMPAEPIQVQGATIVIANPELAPYLTDSAAVSSQKN